MAVKNFSLAHFLIRITGLSGLMAAMVGLVLWLAIGPEPVLVVLTLGGASVVALALLVEVKALVGAVMSQRGAMGSNVALQIILAVILLVGLNWFSFFHFQRYDWTTGAEFTISHSLRKQLSQLRGETDILVYLYDDTKPGVEKTDFELAHYQAAAQRQIVEKVKDLVEEFQLLGPRFRVEVLDLHKQSFKKKLKALGERSPELAAAIKAAPENSIFFLANGRVQRLGFNDIYQLDSEASLAANNKAGNLVLNYQGVGPFANKILNIDEKKPRIGLGVVHEILSLEDSEDPRLTMAGAKKSLVSHGFDTRDIILKKWGEMGPPEPSAYTFDESRFESLEEQRVELEAVIKEREKELKEAEADRKVWKYSTLKELNKQFITVLLPGRPGVIVPQEKLAEIKKQVKQYKTLPIDEEDRDDIVKDIDTRFAVHELSINQEKRELETVIGKQKGLNVENLREQKRITDVSAKMKRLLTDVDLLVVPRMTMLNIARGESIPNRAHKLDDAQVGVIKDYIKAGKPVLFCLGPSNDRGFDPSDFGGGGKDALEELVGDLGFKIPKQTILYNVESKSFAERRGNLIVQGTQVEVPPVEFDWKPGAGLPGRVTRKDLAKMQGKWTLVEFQERGKRQYVGELENMEVNVKDDLLTIQKKGSDKVIRQLQIKLFPAKLPRAIDVTHRAGEDNGKSEQGIYEFDGDTLRIALDKGDKSRPKGFEFPLDESDSMLVMKRVPQEHPIRSSVRLASKSVGRSEAMDLRIRHPRPVYFESEHADTDPMDHTLLMASPESWNEDNPFPSRERTPRFEPPKKDDKSVGTLDEKRRGPFPIAAAAEVDVPASWGGAKGKARVAVIGHGGVFIGQTLTSIKEKLLLDTCNWLLGRDDLLAQSNKKWEYPRVDLDETQKELWHWGTFLGMPMLFVYVGLAVWLVRRMR